RVPVRSRRSRKRRLPRSRRRATQPRMTAGLPASEARSSPQYCVRFRLPRKSSTLGFPFHTRKKSTLKPVTSKTRAASSRCMSNAPDRSGPLQRAFQKVEELGLGKFLLRSVGQSFKGPRTFGYFIIAEDEGIARVELAGALERFAEFLSDGREFDADTGCAKRLGRADCGALGVFAHPSDIHVASSDRCHFGCFL